MGLEGVELLMEVEERFGISIDDREVEKAVTVGQLCEIICRQCTGTDKVGCATQRAFYMLRKGLVSYFRLDRKSLTPAIGTEDVFPRARRSKIWRDFQESAGLRLPRLVLSGFGRGVLWACWVLVAMLSLPYVLRAYAAAGILVFLMYLLAVLTCCLLMQKVLMLTPLASGIPEECGTLGGLTRAVLARNGSRIKHFAKQEVWAILTSIICEQLAIEEHKVTPEARFVDDLGLD